MELIKQLSIVFYLCWKLLLSSVICFSHHQDTNDTDAWTDKKHCKQTSFCLIDAIIHLLNIQTTASLLSLYMLNGSLKEQKLTRSFLSYCYHCCSFFPLMITWQELNTSGNIQGAYLSSICAFQMWFSTSPLAVGWIPSTNDLQYPLCIFSLPFFLIQHQENGWLCRHFPNHSC